MLALPAFDTVTHIRSIGIYTGCIVLAWTEKLTLIDICKGNVLNFKKSVKQCLIYSFI